MSSAGPRTSQRGLGIALIAGFSVFLAVAWSAPVGAPPATHLLAAAGILTGIAMCFRSRWTHVIGACAAALIGVVFLASGITRLIFDTGGIASSILMLALGLGCGIAAVLQIRAARAG